MSKPVTINRFDGGVSDPRETSTTMCTSVRNFIPLKNKLTPYRDTVTETLSSGTLTNQKLTDVISVNYSGTNLGLFALGTAYPNNYPKIYEKSTTSTFPTVSLGTIQSSFTASSNGEGSSNNVIPGSLISYQGAGDSTPFIYCLKQDGTSVYLMKYIYGTSFSVVGSAIGTIPTNGIYPQMFVHPKDNKLYGACGNTAFSYEGTTISTRSFSRQHNITAITWQGNNTILGMVAKDNTGSVLAIWDGSTTSSTLTDVVEFGSDVLLVLDNLNDVVVGVSGISEGGSSFIGVQNRVTIRGFSGGQSIIIKTIESPNGSKVYPFKAHRNSKLFFPMTAYLNGTVTHQIWSIYKTESGLWAVGPDRKVSNDTELASLSIAGFSMIGDYFWVAFSDGQFRRTYDQETYTATSSYETLINPSMELGDRSKMKQLKSVSVSKAHNTGNIGQLVIKYSIDGGQNWVTIGTLSSAGINTLKAVNESTGKPFEQAYEYIFRIESTLGAEITEFKYAYEIIPELI